MNRSMLLFSLAYLWTVSILSGCATGQYGLDSSNPRGTPKTLEQQYQEKRARLDNERAEEEYKKERDARDIQNAQLYGARYKCSNSELSFDIILHDGLVIEGRNAARFSEEGIYKKWKYGTWIDSSRAHLLLWKEVEFNTVTNVYTSSAKMIGDELYESKEPSLHRYQCNRIK